MTTSTTRNRSGMSARQLRRLGGIALIAALPLQVAGFLLHPPGEELRHVVQASYGAAHLILFVSWVLAMLGLPAFYVTQAHRAGKLGLAAFVGTMAATAYHLYLTLYEAAAMPIIATQRGADALVGEGGALAHGAGALGPVAGGLLLAFPLMGVVTLRAGVFPKIAGWLQIASVVTFVVFMLGIGAVTGGQVGPDASNWVGGMLPISSLYWVLFSGWAVAGQALCIQAVADPAPAQPRSQLATATD
ncbi:MAG TPA: hypothetical protein VML96_00275 [Egibacteraceae bacterium]|nr:hypothetical protein [Egibacteraceae bacterium]